MVKIIKILIFSFCKLDKYDSLLSLIIKDKKTDKTAIAFSSSLFQKPQTIVTLLNHDISPNNENDKILNIYGIQYIKLSIDSLYLLNPLK